jgi:DNA invertase Pin-like site-specific DNA recombinase
MASAVRCAIYTRKSTEDGLDQTFNSLDAQREACAAYILSQRHEGWTLLPEAYDDGGFSGGNTDRPGLTRLLAEVRARKVDVIVVYKIDRLTRSLADFARIVEVLDAAGASFVSITQAFNTTTSMGRLTLNVLLSFAQFEREVTGERIRDKIAASKARGMWMGGVVPLGYTVRERKLVVNQAEAATVRHIFQCYLAAGSVLALQGELDSSGVRSAERVTRHGRCHGGGPFSRGALYLMLQNRIYRGEICHKGIAYPGEHQAILDVSLFDAVQSQLEQNRVARLHRTDANAPSLLTGLLWDSEGRRMSPSHANKQARRYRYYVSQADSRALPIARVPAADIEELVSARVAAFLADTNAVYDALAGSTIDAVTIDAVLFAAQRRARQLAEALPHERRGILLALVERVELHQDKVRLALSAAALLTLGGETPAPTPPSIWLDVPARLVRAAKAVRLMIPAAGDQPRRDPALIKLVTKAHVARRAVEAGQRRTLHALACEQGYGRDHFAMLLRISYLAPDITAAIVEGRQPPALTRQRLARVPLPQEWQAQRRLLGFT